MESEQKWRPLYCKEKSRAQTKMAETYCYLEEQFVDDNLQFVNPFAYSLIAHFPSLLSLDKCGNLCLISFLPTFLAEVFLLLFCIDVNADFELALAYKGNVDGSLLFIDQHIPCEILLD
jgi:hypothetical protein